MKIDIKKLPQSQVELTIEVPADSFKDCYDKTILELAREVKREGFRPGKVPKEIIEKEVGEQKILAQAAENCIKENYLKAVDEKEIEPLGQPRVEILKMALGNPLEFKATVSVMPEIKMPDYRKIASNVQKKEVKVTEAEIAKLKEEKERMEKEGVRQEILQKIAEDSEIEIPEEMVERERDMILNNLKQQVSQILQMSFEDYLKKIQKTEEELQQSLLPEAEKRVKNLLVLRAIAEKENIQVSEEEVKEFLEQHPYLKNIDLSPLAKGERIDENQLKEYTKEVIRNEKTLQLLENL